MTIQFPTRQAPNNAAFSGLTVTLPTHTVIKHVPAVTVSASTVDVYQVNDDSVNKVITAYTNFGNYVLWSGSSYTAIGQWTDADVQTRLIAILS